MSSQRIVIVGGGLAAVRTAQMLRDLGHDGEVRILSAESELPYDRPPLSKDYLRGDTPDSGIELLDPTAYQEREIALDLGRKVVSLDTSARTVADADGQEVGYDQLVVATGAPARTLAVLDGREAVFALRTAEDSRRLAAAIREQQRIAIVGGGFIGLEVAATARTQGCPVTVIEAQSAPLLNAVGPEIARWLQERHTAHGVSFRCGCSVTAAEVAPGGGEQLRLSDGSKVDADAVVVGVGVKREIDWLSDAGLEVDDGLVCDASGRTSDPAVFGVGDIVCHRTNRGLLPVGHWTAAVNSTRRAAHALLGLPAPPMPEDGYFWSNQYDLRLQFVGRADPGCTVTVVSGDIAGDSFVAQYRTGDRTTGVFAASNPREFVRHRAQLRKTEELVQLQEVPT